MRSATLLFVLLYVALSVAQEGGRNSSQPGGSYLVQKVASDGSKRFSERDIVQTLGLKAGTRVTVDDLNAAGNRLLQTGVFTQVAFRFDGQTATYTVTDASQFLPVTFENFVWFSRDDLVRRLQNAVPFFDGSVPASGNLTTQVSSALDSILKANNVAGQTIAAPIPADSPQSVQFRIDGIEVKIAEIRFPGAASERAPLLQAATKKILRESYSESSTPGEVTQWARAVYGKLGFLKAQFGSTKISVVQDDAKSPSIALDLPVEEGPQYTFAGADWSGNKAITTADLSKVTNLKLGAPADTSQLAVVVAAAKALYGNKGYMLAAIKATATLDNEKHTSVLHLTIDEGPIYHMGKLVLLNLPPDQEAIVRQVWEIKPGDVYDSAYANTFLPKHPRELRFLSGFAAQYMQTIHDDTQVVDLTLKFQKMQLQP